MVVNACLRLGWRLNGSTDRDRWRRNAGCGDFWLIRDVLVRWRWAIGLWRCVPRWGTKVLLWLLLLRLLWLLWMLLLLLLPLMWLLLLLLLWPLLLLLLSLRRGLESGSAR